MMIIHVQLQWPKLWEKDTCKTKIGALFLLPQTGTVHCLKSDLTMHGDIRGLIIWVNID